MSKKKIVIASILKPVDDTRMYEKMGVSLSKTNKYDVNIIGYSVKSLPKQDNITFHPLFNFSRLSLSRLLAPVKCYLLLRSIRPKTLIVNSHELLFMGFIYCLFNKSRLIYDVRENYYRNILYTKTFPRLIRPLLATWVRFKEYASHLFVDHYFLAEQYYEQEFSFTKGKSTVIENKYQPLDKGATTIERHSSGLKLLFSGTLAESTGVYLAIDLAIKLHDVEPSVTLDIIGYSPIMSVIENIKSKIESFSFITLTGGNVLVPHHEVITKICQANFGIIHYPSNKSTINSTPTKLYEYLANKLPIIMQNHPKWKAICAENSAGITVDFDHFSPQNLLEIMKSQEYYLNSKNTSFLWEHEEVNFLQKIDSYNSVNQ